MHFLPFSGILDSLFFIFFLAEASQKSMWESDTGPKNTVKFGYFTEIFVYLNFCSPCNCDKTAINNNKHDNDELMIMKQKIIIMRFSIINNIIMTYCYELLPYYYQRHCYHILLIIQGAHGWVWVSALDGHQKAL